MNTKSKALLKKMSWIIVTFLLLEAIIITALVGLNTLSQYKLDITSDVLLENFKNTFTHLGVFIKNSWEEKNPFFIIGTIVAILYSLYANSKTNSKKEGWETEDKNAYHGSARWGSLKELFKTPNFFKQQKDSIQADFMKSLKEEEHK